MTAVVLPALPTFLLARIAEDEAAVLLFAQRDLAAFDGSDGWRDPDRVLRECEAKRRIVQRYQSAAATHSSEAWGVIGAMFDLAAVYSDHPDYQQEWRP